MRKQEFLYQLGKRLSGLSEKEADERISFYSELIDDKIEDGLSEEEAVSKIGTVSEVVEQIVSETPLVRLVKEKIKPKPRRTKIRPPLRRKELAQSTRASQPPKA